MQSGETEIISSRPAWPVVVGSCASPLQVRGAWCASESRRVSMCTALRANATTGRALLQPGACKPQSVGLNPGVLHPAFTLLAVAQPDSTSHSFAQESTTIPDPVAFPLQHRGCTLAQSLVVLSSLVCVAHCVVCISLRSNRTKRIPLPVLHTYTCQKQSRNRAERNTSSFSADYLFTFFLFFSFSFLTNPRLTCPFRRDSLRKAKIHRNPTN